MFHPYVLICLSPQVDPDEWSHTPHGTMFETQYSIKVNEQLASLGSGRWRMEADSRRSFVSDPFDVFAS